MKKHCWVFFFFIKDFKLQWFNHFFNASLVNAAAAVGAPTSIPILSSKRIKHSFGLQNALKINVFFTPKWNADLQSQFILVGTP